MQKVILALLNFQWGRTLEQRTGYNSAPEARKQGANAPRTGANAPWRGANMPATGGQVRAHGARIPGEAQIQSCKRGGIPTPSLRM
eukprot:2485733-Rhodomonas_salina.1